jgi:putative SOS response-associated peptidase YedK
VLLVCGRFVSATPLAELAERFLVEEVRAEARPPSYNVAPTDPVYAVAEHDGKRLLGTFRWGLTGTREGGPRPINARAETLLERFLFRQAFARRRCLLPADGFYEWQAQGGRKQPYLISPRDGGVLALAGLWSSRREHLRHHHHPSQQRRRSTARANARHPPCTALGALARPSRARRGRARFAATSGAGRAVPASPRQHRGELGAQQTGPS